MTIDERSRHQLFQRLEAVLGADEAATLMEHLPPVGWADVATKRDLDALATSIRGDLGEFQAEMHREIGGLHRDIGELRGEIGGLRGEMHREVGRVYDQLAIHTRTLTIAMVSSVLTAVALSFATVHL